MIDDAKYGMCDVYLTNMVLAIVEFIFTFHIRRIIIGADLQKRYVGYVHNFEVVFTIVVNDRGVVGLLFGSGVIGRLKSARDELLERRRKKKELIYISWKFNAQPAWSLPTVEKADVLPPFCYRVRGCPVVFPQGYTTTNTRVSTLGFPQASTSHNENTIPG